jgi:GT2 family glycosyltransferase/glycosyltransferase involved in cell wall biosynthesis
MAASIIVPVYNALEFAQACVESIYRARTGVPFEVIVVDNGSSPEVRAWLSREEERRPNFRVLHFDQPLGFPRAINVGARQARYEFLVLLNSDTVVTDGWLDGLKNALATDSRIGVASPVTNSAGNEIQIDSDAAASYPHQARRYAARIRGRRKPVREPQRLVFFCVMIRRDLWERLAGLEEGYAAGNFEDDDFCLRARLAGYELVVARNVFVFHYERATFNINRLDHDGLMARNQLLFCDRASRWARSRDPFDRRAEKMQLNASVIVPVTGGPATALRDSLMSLANQTVSGFETIVVSASDSELTRTVRDLEGRLRISVVEVAETLRNQPAKLLNAGLAAAKGEQIAYLPAGDIYYPFHLELLASLLRNSASDFAYSMWSVVIDEEGQKSRGTTIASQLTPDRLVLGDWAPLLCWMHSRSWSSGARFDESLRAFHGWEFVLRMSHRAKILYAPRVTCERRIASDRLPSDSPVEELQRVMKAFPVEEPFQNERRVQCLEAAESGRWEEALVVTPAATRGPSAPKSDTARRAPDRRRRRRLAGELAHRLAREAYRAVLPLQARHELERLGRRMLGLAPILRPDLLKLEAARQGLAKAILENDRPSRRPGLPDILQFNIIEWDHLTQRPHHFAKELAARGYRVFWVDVKLKPPEKISPAFPPRELEPGIFYVELPATNGELYNLNWDSEVLATMEMAIAQIRAACGIERAIQLVNFPKWAPLVFRLRDRFGWPIVYDCLDDQKSFAALYRHDGATFEDELAQNCELLVTCSRLLYQDRCGLNRNTVLIPNAADYNLFRSAVPTGLLEHLPRPIVGFFGAFSDWLDLDWIQEVARRFPHWSFVYIGRDGFARPAGHKRWKEVTAAANIHVFPQADLKKLAAYLTEFDVCTMPFQDLPMTRIMNPVKIYEYLAAGKPVVVPDLAEIRPLAERGLIETYRDHEHSFRVLEQVTKKRATPDEVGARQASAAQNTWTHRVAELISKFPSLGICPKTGAYGNRVAPDADNTLYANRSDCTL